MKKEKSTATIIQKVEKVLISPWASGELDSSLHETIKIEIPPEDDKKSARVFRRRNTTLMKVPKNLLSDQPYKHLLVTRLEVVTVRIG